LNALIIIALSFHLIKDKLCKKISLWRIFGGYIIYWNPPVFEHAYSAYSCWSFCDLIMYANTDLVGKYDLIFITMTHGI